ncbi:hypothetical protein NMYAN_120132 [Nitrosomonas nitrosa]|uniref:Uncharacterized protein n=1 Tax=Nitrosomonas nitrosa TaxID=52442 RepID=A0A8H8YXW8_9PROT|nr:hypothetical protein NMYAN_120132 [Nitrosomonas nitrosa]
MHLHCHVNASALPIHDKSTLLPNLLDQD